MCFYRHGLNWHFPWEAEGVHVWRRTWTDLAFYKEVTDPVGWGRLGMLYVLSFLLFLTCKAPLEYVKSNFCDMDWISVQQDGLKMGWTAGVWGAVQSLTGGWLLLVLFRDWLLLGALQFPNFISNIGEGMQYIRSKSKGGGGGSTTHDGRQVSYSEGHQQPGETS